MGPLEFTVLGFEGGQSSFAVLRILAEAHTQEAVRVIDLLFFSKGDSGKVMVRETSDLASAELDALGAIAHPDVELRSWFSLDDVEVVSDLLPLSTSAVAILLEHVWVTRLRSALLDAGGFAVSDGRVPSTLVDEVDEVLTATGQ